MTDNQKKQYLEQYIFIDRHIDRLIAEKQHWYDRALQVTPSFSMVSAQRSGVSDKTSSAIEKVVIIEHKIDCEIDRLCDMRSIISDAVAALRNRMQAQIIHMRYIRGMTFEAIADETGYCSKQVQRIHKQALAALDFGDDKCIVNAC